MTTDACLKNDSFYDVVVLGGGAAGLMAAATAGKRGRTVLVIEVSNKLGKKILMSGGGRCNFTNLEVKAEHFLSQNPHFVKSALSQYSNWDFIGLVAAYGVEYHEKDHGQLFCDHSSKDILKVLVSECEQNGVEFALNTSVTSVTPVKVGEPAADELSVEARVNFNLQADSKRYACQSVVVATGGLSIPSLGGATGLGYQLAQQFGLELVPRSASLVPFTLSGRWLDFVASLSGVSLPVTISVPSKQFYESMLFTHRGLSGPCVLQLSNYWALGEAVTIDLLPNSDMRVELIKAKEQSPKAQLQAVLAKALPKSLALSLIENWWPELSRTPLQEIKQQRLFDVANDLHQWCITPSGTEGYRTAEVTKGGVDVGQVLSKTMQHKTTPNLFFVGEVLDVTGHLGGFNFQWAWSSGYVAGINA